MLIDGIDRMTVMGNRDYAMLRLLWDNALRRAEMCGLDRSDFTVDLNGGDVRSAQAHSRHKNLATLIRYDDGRQQLQGKAAKTLADAISERDVDTER
jgi:site-specific recombinase XerD